MTKPALRTALVVLATVFAIGAPIVHALTGFGITQQEFARQGDETLRAAGYAFSIWGVIYAGLAFYAVWQALPRTPESPVLRAVAWPSVVAVAGCGVWIFISALDLRWASVAVIVVSAGAAITAVWRAAPHAEVRQAQWPLGLLAGWLTAAAALNILTVATAEGTIPAGQQVQAAIGGIAGVAVATAAVLARTRSAPFAIAVVWALVGVWAAHRTEGGVIPALAIATAVATLGAWLLLRRR